MAVTKASSSRRVSRLSAASTFRRRVSTSLPLAVTPDTEHQAPSTEHRAPFWLMNLLVDQFFQRKARQPFWLTRFSLKKAHQPSWLTRFRQILLSTLAYNADSDVLFRFILLCETDSATNLLLIRNRFRCRFCSSTCWLSYFFNEIVVISS